MEELKCPPVHAWIKQLWYIYTMEYYSAIRKMESLPFATAWIYLESEPVRERKMPNDFTYM